jgi:predicted nucleic acid-binding protein
VNEDSAIVPPTWSYEVANVLLVAERTRRKTEAETLKFLGLLAEMPIAVDQAEPKPFGSVLTMARAHRLSTYDAAYLELAARLGLPLATLDKELIRAAREAGVKVIKS